MINLLPPEEKQNLAADQQRKIIFILGLVVMIFFSALVLVLVSVNITVATQLKGENILLQNKESALNQGQVQEIRKEITQANNKMSDLGNFYKNKVSMSGFLSRLSGIFPKEIYLKSISINPLSSGPKDFQVIISGHATSIENVIDLNNKLKSETGFSQITFPQDTWFEKQDFDFDLTFKASL